MDIGNPNPEGSHQSNIRKLVEEFGSDNESLISLFYERIRDKIEKEATVPCYIHIVTYQTVRNILDAYYKKKNLNPDSGKVMQRV